jgi:MinD superfamily P-loop ATPase
VPALAVPCGVVINRADPAGESATLDFCRQAALPVILKIPLDIEIARAYSQGLTLVEAFPQWKAAFINAFEMIQEFVNARNRSHQR